ncbi:hypothetical protein MMC22_006871 [Lobaria immixta]|nr:hypothetical protein [Lobaria immixta]
MGVETIRSGEYTKSFAGDYLLPEIAAPPHLPMYSGKELIESVQKLNTENYADHLLDCLLLDFDTQSAENHLYDMYGVSLEVSNASHDIYKLHVPGIREGAPAIAYGDQVMLRQLRLDPDTSLPLGMEAFFYRGGESDGRTPAPGFTGYQINAVVVAVAKSVEDVFLRVNGVLPERLVFNVCFSVQVRHFQSVKRAVESIRDDLAVEHPGQVEPSNWLRCMLFPSEADGIWQKDPPSGMFRQTWFDETLNYEQKKAVDAIQSRNYGKTPFIIHGPPGTGKTKTICETVKQLCNDPNFDGAILLCAPSDPAADQLALRLKAQFDPTEMFRLNDYSRTFAEVPEKLLSYCYVDSSIFNLPPFPILMGFKIIITTCQAVDVLVQARTTNRDLALLETNLNSMLHPRFGRQSLSNRGSSLHWGALLVDEAAQATEPELVRGRRWPVLFACNAGVDTCEDVHAASGGGWYNLREAKKAIAYAIYLISSDLVTMQSDICIMAPFDTQVRLLRTMARAKQLWGVNIGPVEAFQGLESRVVIFCTTRTRTRFVKDDNERGIGIMGEAKKFNVGLTRAKEGLIVLGNPCVLGQDECWGAFLGFCWRNGLWQNENFEGERRIEDFVEDVVDGAVNTWAPPENLQAEESRRGLERALIHRDDEGGAQAQGSHAARRFLGESLEDGMWRMGLEAEAQVLGI